MKFILAVLLIITSSNVYAMNVYYNKNTSQVMTISNSPVILSTADQQIIVSAILPNNFDINTLAKPFSYYNYVNGNVSLNAAMILDDENTQIDLAKKNKKIADAKSNAIAKLTDAISRVATQDVLTQQELSALLPGS